MTWLMAILAGWRVPPAFQRFLAYVIVIGGACLLLWGAWMIGSAMFRGWVQDGKEQAVTIDRVESNRNAERAKHAAEIRAAADKHADELAAQRERAQIEEAINASLHDPGGDPMGAALDRMRKGNTAR